MSRNSGKYFTPKAGLLYELLPEYCMKINEKLVQGLSLETLFLHAGSSSPIHDRGKLLVLRALAHKRL